MIGLFPLMASVATAAPPGDLVEQVQAAWKSTTAYCGAFVFAAHGTRNMAVSKGRSCVEPAKRILTEEKVRLDHISDYLLEHETIDEEQVPDLFDAPFDDPPATGMPSVPAPVPGD